MKVWPVVGARRVSVGLGPLDVAEGVEPALLGLLLDPGRRVPGGEGELTNPPPQEGGFLMTDYASIPSECGTPPVSCAEPPMVTNF